MSKYRSYSPGATTLLYTTAANYDGREGTRFYFADGRYITVWHDGAIRLLSSSPDAPDWEVDFIGVGSGGGRRWEGGAKEED